MWRCNILLVIGFLSAGYAGAQADTSLFVRNAGRFDELLPQEGWKTGLPQLSWFVKDSEAFVRRHQSYTVSVTHRVLPKSKDDKDDITDYRFDAEGRIVSCKLHQPDAAPVAALNIQYGPAGTLFSVNSMSAAESRSDTIRYTYDRAGHLVRSCTHTHQFKNDSSFCAQRLYNSEGKLIVYEAADYAGLSGTFTYEYDARGRLQRRCFLARQNGVVLCTDSLVYTFNDGLKQQPHILHFLKVAGGSWMLIDEALFDEKGRVMLYVLHKGPQRQRFDDVKPGWHARFTYNEQGRLSTIYKSDSLEKYFQRIELTQDTITHIDSVKIFNGQITGDKKAMLPDYVMITQYDDKGFVQKYIRLEWWGNKRKITKPDAEDDYFFSWTK